MRQSFRPCSSGPNFLTNLLWCVYQLLGIMDLKTPILNPMVDFTGNVNPLASEHEELSRGCSLQREAHRN